MSAAVVGFLIGLPVGAVLCILAVILAVRAPSVRKP